MTILGNSAQMANQHLRFQESLDKSLQVIELANRAENLRAEVLSRIAAVISLLSIGNLEEARQHNEGILPLAERLRDRFWLSGALACTSLMSVLGGDWRQARDFSDRSLIVHPLSGRYLPWRALLEYEFGDFSQGEAYLEQAIEAMRLLPAGPNPESSIVALTIPLVGRISGLADRFDITEAYAGTVLSSPGVIPFDIVAARAGLALMAVQRGDEGAAGEQYAAIESQRGTMLTFGRICADRLLSLLAQTIGNLEGAEAHFEDALVFCRRAGYRPELAWTCCDYADMLRERDSPGDHEKAAALWDESLAISRELGMRPLMERVLSRREILGA